MSTRPMEIRFFEKVFPEPNTGCWLWCAANRNGYGYIYVDGKFEKASRVSYRMHKGPIPKGLHILHVCDNPHCVNPDHLWAGTPLDNMLDMVRKGRGKHGITHHAAKLSDDDIREIRKMTSRAASEKYNICTQHAGMIIRRKRWKHVI